MQPVSVRNNNPGNLVDPRTGQIKRFDTPEQGQAALEQDLQGKLSGASPAYKAKFGDAPVSPLTLAETWAPANAPGNSPESTTNYARHIANTLGIDVGDTIPNTPEALNKVARAITEFESGQRAPAPRVQMAAAPSTTMTDVTAPTTGRVTQPTQLAQAQAPAPAAPPAAPRRVPSMVSIRAEQEAEKLERAEDIKVVAKEYETFRDNVKTAPIKETTASEAITLLTRDSTIAGFFQKPGVGAALGTLIKSGISAPGGHSIGVKELDEVLFKGQKNITPEQIRARDRLRTLLDTNSLLASSIMKGQGAVTQFERELVARMVGSLDSTPENLVKIQQILQARAQLDMKLGEEFRKSGLTYNKFTSSDVYANAHRDYTNKIKQIESSDVRTPLSQSQKPPQGQGTTSGGVKWREVR